MKKVLSLCLVIAMVLSLSTTAFASGGTWQQDSYGWWYLNSDGTYPADSWLSDGGNWYYFGSDGYMTTGWVWDGYSWYYMNPSGAMATGWVEIGGYWYYFNASGVMATGTQTIDGVSYDFAQSGEWLGGGSSSASSYDFQIFNWGTSIEDVLYYMGEPNYVSPIGDYLYNLYYYSTSFELSNGTYNADIRYCFSEGKLYSVHYNIHNSYSNTLDAQVEYDYIVNYMISLYGNPTRDKSVTYLDRETVFEARTSVITMSYNDAQSIYIDFESKNINPRYY